MRRPFPHSILNDIGRHPMPRSSPLLQPRDEVPSRLMGCVAIVAALTAFFWVYGTAAHRDPLVGNWMLDDGATTRGGVHALIAPTAPAPDMRSAAISFANSDVKKSAAQPAAAKQAAAAEPDTAHAAEPAKPRHKPVTRLSPAAANAYASSPRGARSYSRPEIGASGSF